jgi:chromosome segregation ATPase
MLNARLKEVEGLTSRIEVIESEKQALFYKVQTLQMEREKYNQRIEQLQLEKETTIKQVEDRDEVRHLKRTLEDMKFELEGARKKQNAALDEYEELRVKLKTAENSREIAELNGQRMQKRIYEMELELEGANFSEVNSLRRRIFEVEEALRIADNLNQEMAEKMD